MRNLPRKEEPRCRTADRRRNPSQINVGPGEICAEIRQKGHIETESFQPGSHGNDPRKEHRKRINPAVQMKIFPGQVDKTQRDQHDGRRERKYFHPDQINGVHLCDRAYSICGPLWNPPDGHPSYRSAGSRYYHLGQKEKEINEKTENSKNFKKN